MHADGARPIIPFCNGMSAGHISRLDPAFYRQPVTRAEIKAVGGRHANVGIRPNEIERLP